MRFIASPVAGFLISMNPSIPASECPLVGVQRNPISPTIVAIRLIPPWPMKELPCTFFGRFISTNVTNHHGIRKLFAALALHCWHPDLLGAVDRSVSCF
jgi:hypothetical protein